MHPSPASNLLNRRSLTAYTLYFREEQRRLFEEPNDSALNAGNNGPPNHRSKVAFRDLARVVSNNWKGLQPEVKESYGKLAAFQRRQYELENEKSAAKVWKNHQKVPPPPITFEKVPLPCLVEDDEVDQVVDDVLAELEMDESETKTVSNPVSVFWPLKGCPTPIADFVRCQSYPQHVLKHTTTCLPCTEAEMTQNPYTEVLKNSLDENGRDFFLSALLMDEAPQKDAMNESPA